ncbi:hypothetical protein MACH26_40680 [Planctobacterium marinum]|uniref:Membrane protein insertion efficiency factor YidD n=2 Tax=Planctobacterium marinum TaxID=1631968 RepID=A0AA48HTR4_9ALTE|nr:hypothetical protein MACH26_40680 [Planctobacterium marinum]
MKTISILAIRIYQKFLSPYKGFRCAHAALYKGDSCSNAVLKIIEQQGLVRGYCLIRQRFNDCKAAHVVLVEKKDKDKKEKGKWYDCCDPSPACNVTSCSKNKGCDLPELPCDCSFL